MTAARAMAMLLILALLGACGGPPSAQRPSSTPAQQAATPTGAAASPTVVPTGGPAPSPGAEQTDTAPTTTRTPLVPTASLAGPTPAPPAGNVLPAPIYVIDAASGQVVRVERDGRTAAQVTFEAARVLELALAAGTGTLAYVIGGPEGDRHTLVLLDGSGRRERLYGNISGVAISDDGQRVVYRLDDPEPGLIVGRHDSPSGVWSSLPYGPGRPGLVLPDEPADGDYDPEAPAWRYTPVGFAPREARLALLGYDADGPAIPGGELLFLGPEDGALARGPTCCEWPTWSDDGAALLSAGGGPGPDLRYGLYRTDSATGVETPLIEQAPDGPVPLVTAPRQLADGTLYAFVELAPAAGFSWEHPFRPRLARIGPDGTVAPLSVPVTWPAAVLWADDASGAVVASFADDGAVGPPAWVPADGSPARPLAVDGVAAAWAPARPLFAGDCTIFEDVRYEEPAARRFSGNAYDVQARLAARGFDAGAADGFYGERTRAAVRAFQAERGLPASGDVDCATWQALLGAP